MLERRVNSKWIVSLFCYALLLERWAEIDQSTIQSRVVQGLDFTKNNHIAYLNLVLNTSVRLGDFFVFQQFFKILQSNNLEESFLIKAASLFMSANNISDFINPTM